MAPRTYSLICLILGVAALSIAQPAQTGKTVTIRMLDERTGSAISTSNLLIRINHQDTVHADWVHQSEDGSVKLTLPPDATLLEAEATYDTTMQIYVDCDTVKDKRDSTPHWYAISDIIANGVAAPNGCSKRKAAAKPGEFVFFVRKRGLREFVKDY